MLRSYQSPEKLLKLNGCINNFYPTHAFFHTFAVDLLKNLNNIKSFPKYSLVSFA